MNVIGWNARLIMDFQEAAKKACEEPTLLDALTWICLWESERARHQARFNFGSGSNGAGWDTCFRVCLKEVMENYTKQTTAPKHT